VKFDYAVIRLEHERCYQEVTDQTPGHNTCMNQLSESCSYILKLLINAPGVY